MAAEKLTRARLAQIIVMLLILVAAFTWRTYQHKEYDFSKCDVNKCVFMFNKESISIIKIVDGYILKGKLGNVDIELIGSKGTINNSAEAWQIETQSEKLNILLTNQDKHEIVRLNLQK